MKGKVLIVDDERLNVEVLGRFLTGAGYDVFSAGSAEEALALAEKEQLDAILLDNVLPGMTGLQAIAGLMKRSKAAIILMTGDDGQSTREDALLLGARGFLGKPIDFKQLDAELQKAIGRAPAA